MAGESLDLTQHWVGYTAVAIFVFAYALVMAEAFNHLPPVAGMMTGLGYLMFFGYYLKK